MLNRYLVSATVFDDKPKLLHKTNTIPQAEYWAKKEFDKLKHSGFSVYLYENILVWDARDKKIVELFEFDVTYLYENEAITLFDADLDIEHGPVTIKNKAYLLSRVLKNTDPVEYFHDFAEWLDDKKVITV